jgi:hypothetical protein
MTTRLDSFATAIARFSEALSAPTTDLTRDAAIQRFEFCFELAWKVIQEQARAEGLDCQSPKGCFKLAYKNNWISRNPASSPCWKMGTAPNIFTTKRDLWNTRILGSGWQIIF